MRVGYARVSSRDQDLTIQLAKLADCDKVFQEKESATSAKRPALTACLDFVREGDVLVCSRLDRLARSTLHLCQIAAELERKQVALKVLDQDIETETPSGRLLFNMLGAVAQFENEIRRERQRDGIMLARQRGRCLGSKPKLSAAQQEEMCKARADGFTIASLAAVYHIKKSTVYRYLRAGAAAEAAQQQAGEA